jgi:hypothetical protein
MRFHILLSLVALYSHMSGVDSPMGQLLSEEALYISEIAQLCAWLNIK